MPAFEDFHAMRARHQPVDDLHLAIVEVLGAGTAEERKALGFVECRRVPGTRCQDAGDRGGICATMIATRVPPDSPAVYIRFGSTGNRPLRSAVIAAAASRPTFQGPLRELFDPATT